MNKRTYFIIALVFFLATMVVFIFKPNLYGVNTNKIPTKENPPQMMVSQDPFSIRFSTARENIVNGNYSHAIAYLNESLNYAGIGIEKGMVYRVLAEIYRDLGNLDKELEYIQLVPKYTMNDRIKQKAGERVKEIYAALENPEAPRNSSERFSTPPLYGRPFRSYREVVIAQAYSRDHLNNGSNLLRDKKYWEAIEEYKIAYYPDSTDNGFIEAGLIRAFHALNLNQEAITLIDYTLQHNNWGPENLKEFRSLREKLLSK